jgi:XTP/dITP diphosphohydrolase
VGAKESAARFVCAVALAEVPGKTGRRPESSSAARIVYETRGTVEGRIAPEPAGDGGFGYDPIFYYPPFGCTLAEAGRRKSDVSHRGAAFRALRTFLATRPAPGRGIRE